MSGTECLQVLMSQADHRCLMMRYWTPPWDTPCKCQ